MSDEIPRQVHDTEVVLRAIKTPAHINTKTNRLRPAALKSPIDEVSVMRLDYLGFADCRNRARKMSAYIGIARLKVSVIRECGSEVYDSREGEGLFIGHAHISHGVILEPNEPPDSHTAMALNERIQAMLKHTRLEIDPGPDVDWEGDERPLHC